MSIRPLKESDYPIIFDIYAKSKLDELRYEENTFELLPLEQDEKRFGYLKESAVFVYDDNGVVGFGAVCGSEIRALFVDPDARGQGIGKQLLTFLLSRIDGTASLYIARSNFPAWQLYSQFGFEVTGEFETSYNDVPVYACKMCRR